MATHVSEEIGWGTRGKEADLKETLEKKHNDRRAYELMWGQEKTQKLSNGGSSKSP